MFIKIFILLSTLTLLICSGQLCETPRNALLKPTCPLTNNELTTLVDLLEDFFNLTNCTYNNETCAKTWMEQVNFVYGKTLERSEFLEFRQDTNISAENARLLVEFAPLLNRVSSFMLLNGKKFYENSQNWDSKLRRMLFLTRLVSPTSPASVSATTTMVDIWSTTKVCLDNTTKNCETMEPGLSLFLANTRNYDMLYNVWKGFYDKTGPKIKPFYIEYVNAQNQLAKEYGYKDMSEMWIEELETPDLEKVTEELYQQIKPLYQQLHAYVRRKLRDFYGMDKVNSSLIPAHILGNMWAQKWTNIYDIVIPYPNAPSYNVTAILQEKNYTVHRMFKQGEDFFLSIGLFPLSELFWNYSMFEKPTNRNAVCHASSYDFLNGYDFRVAMCTKITRRDFFIAHYELGRIEYFMAYSKLPVVMRKGANSGFHEAIGDTISLSVSSTKHLERIGFLKGYTRNNESDINFLLHVALDKIAFLPFGYIVDKWRWDVFRGKITPENYNRAWWKLVNDYQGVDSIEKRNETYFDPGSKYHVPADVPYIRYFIAHILQFQFYQGLCRLANHTGPLHTCDYSGSSAAGEKFKEMLSLGASKHWAYALELLTGYKSYNTSALLEYFSPLMVWLQKENSLHPEDLVGW